MKNIALLLLLVSVFSINGFTQDVFKDDRYGFSMQQPKNWLTGDKKLLTENLDKVKFSETELAALIKNNNNSYLLVSFYKYDITKHAGIIPTIQVNVRNNPTQNFDQFQQTISKSTESLKSYFPDFSFVTPPQEVKINGVSATHFVATYTLQHKNGNQGKVRVANYAIPHGKFFFQVSMIDELNSTDDEATLYAELAKTIKIGK